MIEHSKELINLKVESINELERIKEILAEFDSVFTPPISDRISDMHTYAIKLSTNANVLYVMDNSEYIGFAVLYANDKIEKIAYLSLIGVKLLAQNKRVGTLLLLDCIHKSKDVGMSKLKLEVVSKNQKAIDFYKKHGFKFCGKASAESIYMNKIL